MGASMTSAAATTVTPLAPAVRSVDDATAIPTDKWGSAVGAGLKVNFPMIGPGDYFQAQVNYTEGAMRYAATTPAAAGSRRHLRETATNFGFGFTDAMLQRF